jgi:predicted metal-dependent peptidase
MLLEADTAADEAHKIAKFNDLVTKTNFVIFKKYPLFGSLLTKLSVVRTTDLPTMAVDADGNIFMNPDFTLSLSFDEVIGVLCHEVMHIGTLSLFRIQNRDMRLWNVATDYMINRALTQDGFKLPKGGLIPDMKNDQIVLEPSMLPGLTIPPGKKFIIKDLKHKTEEHVYNELLKIKKELGDQGEDFADQMEKLKEQLDKHIYKGMDKPKPDEGEENKVQSDAGRGENYWKDQVEAASLEAKERGGGVGASGESGVGRGMVDAAMKPKVNWKEILRNFFTKTSSVYTWSRPAKRALGAGYYAPKVVPKPDIDIVVAIDTSGSIDDETFKQFLAEIKSILHNTGNKTKVKLLLFHSSVYDEVDLTPQNITQAIGKIKPESGGTTFSSVAQYIKKHNIKPKATVYLTDGYNDSSSFDVPDGPRLFFIVQPHGTHDMVKRYGPSYDLELTYS